MIQAIKQMHNTDITCLLVGGKATPAYNQELKDLIQTLPEQTTLKMVSVGADKMPLVYALSDVVVSASLFPESFGRTIAEANAMNKIVVAFNHGGPTETIVDGKTGFLVPVADVSALATALDKVLNLTPEAKKTMERAARKNTEDHFSVQKMCEKTLNLYKEILS